MVAGRYVFHHTAALRGGLSYWRLSMIRIASQPKPTTPEWHEVFLGLLPAIRQHARISFRHLDPEGRAEAIQASLIVLGKRSHTVLHRWMLGSNSERVLKYAHCPVMIVH